MSWTNFDVDRSSYILVQIDDFALKHPGVLDTELSAIKRLQSLFKIFEDANYFSSLPRPVAENVKNLSDRYISEILKPLANYSPRSGQPFGGVYAIDTYVNNVHSFFNEAYASLSPYASLLKAELFDYSLIQSFPREDTEGIKDKLEELKKFSKTLPVTTKKIIEAEKAADEWIEKQNQVLEKLINTKSRELDASANRHAGFRQYVWALAALILGAVAFYIGYSAVQELEIMPTTNVSLGFGILKFSAVAAPLFGAYLCYYQYSYHRSMFDALKFRAIALANLATLSKQYPDSKGLIFEKGIDLIFNEPRTKQPSIKLTDLNTLISNIKK